MAIYGLHKKVKGNVTAEGFKDHFRCESFHFAVGRAVSMEAGNMANRETTRPSLSEISFTKKADNSLTSLFDQAVVGAQGEDMEFKFVRTGADAVKPYLTVKLTNAIISGYTVSADADGGPMETVSVSYSKIMMNYEDNDAVNAKGNPQRSGYDLETAKKQ